MFLLVVHKYQRKVVFEIFPSRSSLLVIIYLVHVLLCVPRGGSLSSHFLSTHEHSSQIYTPACVHLPVPEFLFCSSICNKGNPIRRLFRQRLPGKELVAWPHHLGRRDTSYLMARLSFSYVMLLLFFFFPHSWATASDFKNLKMPSDRSSHLINPGFLSGFRRISRINSHKWVPLGSVTKRNKVSQHSEDRAESMLGYHFSLQVRDTIFLCWIGVMDHRLTKYCTGGKAFENEHLA